MKIFGKKNKHVFSKSSVVVRNTFLSPSVPKRRKKVQRRSKQPTHRLIVSFFVFLTFYLIFVGYVLFFSQEFSLNTIEIETEQEETRQKAIDAMKIYFEKKIFGFLPRNTFFLVQNKEVEVFFSETFSSLEFVSVEKKFPHTIRISLEERNSLIVWCPLKKDVFLSVLDNQKNTKNEELKENNALEEEKKEEKETSSNEEELVCQGDACEAVIQDEGEENGDEFDAIGEALSNNAECLIVDNFGKILGKTWFLDEIQKQEQKVFLAGMDGSIPKEGDSVLQADIVTLIDTLPKILQENLYIEIANIIRIPSPFADELTLRTQDGWDIHMRTDIPLEENITMLRTFLARVLPTEDQATVRWVDIRVPKKIYYAIKKDQSEEGDAEKKEVKEEVKEEE